MDVERLLLVEFAQQMERCQFAFRVEAVAALGFESGRAVCCKLVQCRERPNFQFF